MTIYDQLESEVRSYCRQWPVEFDTARGSTLVDTDGREYLDFFAGAGALNYGHNPSRLKHALLAHIDRDGLTHGLDMHSTAKHEFLQTFSELVLAPRQLRYKVQFPGPTGANAVEAALKLARKVTGRQTIVHFTRSFHGMTLGALSVTSNPRKRKGAGVALTHTVPMPFDGYLGEGHRPFAWFETLLTDAGSGLDKPAAAIVETVQGEGGLNAASVAWLQELAAICARHGVLLIVDDVQMGAGRTGPFFSFEIAGIEPDLVCLSKSISGYGLPMSLLLIRPEHDQWTPGEHNGTFRGNNHAFVTATAALDAFWRDDTLHRSTLRKGEVVAERLARVVADRPNLAARVKGRGLARGLEFRDAPLADKISAAVFEAGLLLETAGPDDEVLKLMPPLVVTDDELERGLDIVVEAIDRVTA